MVLIIYGVHKTVVDVLANNQVARDAQMLTSGKSPGHHELVGPDAATRHGIYLSLGGQRPGAGVISPVGQIIV